MAFGILAEALARIEHKVDALLDVLKSTSTFGQYYRIPKVGDFSHNCPVCEKQVEYYIDAREGILRRKCGCKTGKVAAVKLEPVTQQGVSNGRRED